jgi:hypothetical protein
MDDTRLPRAARSLLAALLLALVCAATAAAPAARADGSPAARWPAAGSTVRAAMSLAAEHWGASPCGGRVALAWGSLGPALNAESTWANAVDPWTQPSRNTDCAITLSLETEWDWPKLCTAVVHEVGHLAGHDHVDDPDDVMSPVYGRPDFACATTPEPVETGALATLRSAPATAKAKAKPKARAKPRVKRAKRRHR